MDYNFFDYKNEIVGYSGQDMFGTSHIIVMIASFIALILVCIAARKASCDAVSKYLKITAVWVPLMDLAKIIWESYYDIAVYGGDFNLSGLLPVYACNLFVYTLPFAAWGKGRVRETALSFLGTLCIFFGLTNFIYLNVLNTYPIFTYASFTALIFHFMMVLTGVLILSTGFWRPTWKAVLGAETVILLFSLFVAPLNYFLNDLLNCDWIDYCFLYSGKSCPVVLNDIYKLLGQDLRPLYTVIAAFSYTVPAVIIVSIEKFIFAIADRIKLAKHNGERNVL